jgi:hypothetical protein
MTTKHQPSLKCSQARPAQKRARGPPTRTRPAIRPRPRSGLTNRLPNWRNLDESTEKPKKATVGTAAAAESGGVRGDTGLPSLAGLPTHRPGKSYLSRPNTSLPVAGNLASDTFSGPSLACGLQVTKRELEESICRKLSLVIVRYAIDASVAIDNAQCPRNRRREPPRQQF